MIKKQNEKLVNTKSARRLLEEVGNGISVNEFTEMPIYNQNESTKDYLTEWEKRNNVEIKNTLCLNFEQSFLVIDESCKIDYQYPRAKDSKGNYTDDLDTSKPKNLVFKWYDALNSGHILRLAIKPSTLALMYNQLGNSAQWDSVFQYVTYTTNNMLTVNTKYRKYNDTNRDNLKTGQYAFLAYPALGLDNKPIVHKLVFTDTNEQGQEIERTYYVHIMSASIEQLQLVKID